MPRQKRQVVAGMPLHVVQRGVARNDCFFCALDYQNFMVHLADLCEQEMVALHAFVLMTNHFHLLLTPSTDPGVSNLMKRLGQRHTQYINRCYRRTGTLWDGRFRSRLIDSDAYLLACQRYIEMNPVRAGMVEHPAQYLWSSYKVNAFGAEPGVLTYHPAYLALGRTPAERRHAYRRLFEGQSERFDFGV